MSETQQATINTGATSEAAARGGVLVVGSANMDLYTRLDHIPVGGETILGSPIWTSPGGKGANQAAAAARLGADVRFVGRVGDDEYGQRLRQGLLDAGADVSLLRTGDSPSSVALILLTPDGENSIIVSPSSNQHVSPADVDAAWQPGQPAVGAVVCQLEIPLATVVHASELAQQHGARFVLNAAPAQELPADLVGRADPLVVNESEAEFLLGTTSEAPSHTPETLVRGLLELGSRSVVLTLGGDGAAVGVNGGGFRHVTGFPVPVVDTTGAGDAFVAALVTRLVAGEDLFEAADYANVVGALVVQHEGAQASYPDAAEVEAQIASQN
ncbi:ribokinase [Tessaracoccus rhinocerotis]|nr:ribokinase [Tessaracoccus rhinocerotis]